MMVRCGFQLWTMFYSQIAAIVRIHEPGGIMMFQLWTMFYSQRLFFKK